jgi:hypothetical protein
MSLPVLFPGIIVSAIASLLPDIDEPESLIANAPDAAQRRLKRGKKGVDRSTRRSVGVLLSALQILFQGLAYLVRILAGGHRGATHMLLIAAGLSAGMYFLGDAVGVPSLWMWFAAGYLSHLVLDMLTPSGLEFLWPLIRRPLHLVPRPLCITTGSVGDTVVRVILMAAAAWLLYQQYPTLT